MGVPLVLCGECGKRASPVMGDVISQRGDWDDRLFYLCECGAYVGANVNTGLAMGKPAGPETRAARARCHRDFDRLWKGRIMNREAAYRWLAEKMDLDRMTCHIGRFGVAQCERVTRLTNAFMEGLSAEQIEAARAVETESGGRSKLGGKKASRKSGKTRLSRLGAETRDRASRHGMG